MQLRWLSEQRRACLLIEPILLLDPAQPVTLDNWRALSDRIFNSADYVMRFRSPLSSAIYKLQQQFFPLHLTLQIKLYSPVLLRPNTQLYLVAQPGAKARRSE